MNFRKSFHTHEISVPQTDNQMFDSRLDGPKRSLDAARYCEESVGGKEKRKVEAVRFEISEKKSGFHYRIQKKATIVKSRRPTALLEKKCS